MFLISAVASNGVVFADSRDDLVPAIALAESLETETETTYSDVEVFDGDCHAEFFADHKAALARSADILRPALKIA